MTRNAKKEDKKQKASSSKKTQKRDPGQAHEFETMSQIQNRYGSGRERSGSDGSSTEGRGSNH